MADVSLPQKNGRRKTHAIRVDLTPMVDLGFLLIAFFMYTTTIAKPNAMEVNMPVNGGPQMPYCEECTVTLIPTKDHRIAFYKGLLNDPAQLHFSSFNQDSLRHELTKEQKFVKALPESLSADAHKLHIIIKPDDHCTYEDIVRILDEMSILDIRYYAMTDITDAEKQVLTEKLQ